MTRFAHIEAKLKYMAEATAAQVSHEAAEVWYEFINSEKSACEVSLRMSDLEMADNADRLIFKPGGTPTPIAEVLSMRKSSEEISAVTAPTAALVRGARRYSFHLTSFLHAAFTLA